MAYPLTVLRTYAEKKNPASLPPSILFSFTDTTITLFDAFPKSIFHFLVVPRVQPSKSLTVFDLASLRTLLHQDKEKAHAVLLDLAEEAKNMRESIEEEMLKRYGFKWGIWTGFHAVPSMEHLHLHVISDDLCSPKLKLKKHYNSFHPEHGFFLPLDDILSWFEADPTFFETMSKLSPREYEPRLKEELSCWRCGQAMKNIPVLKAHLQEEWDKEAKKEKAVLARKRKREIELAEKSAKQKKVESESLEEGSELASELETQNTDN